MVILPLSMAIDIGTLAYHNIRKKLGKEKDQVNLSSYPNASVSVLIPAFNEGERLRSTIDSIRSQNYKPKNIFILDDLSTDTTEKISIELAEKYSNVHHIRLDEKKGKAGNINSLVKERSNDLGSHILVLDGDVKLEPGCLEEMVRSSEGVAAVTGFGYTKMPDNYFARMIYEGETWINSVFSFRKRAQTIRKGVFVVCGALTLYEKGILSNLPIPERTTTEDTDYTWLLQEKGFRIGYNKNARAIGGSPNSLKAYWRRYTRWGSGTFQNLYTHNKDLNKSKSLLYSTIVPGVIEAVPYSLAFASLPIMAKYYPDAAKGLLLADFMLSLPFLFSHPKGFFHAANHLPDIYTFKYFGSLAVLYSGIKTTVEKLTGKESSWKNDWSNSSRIIIQPRRLRKSIMKNNIDDFLRLEEEWSNMGDEAWTYDNFMQKKPDKWKLSNYVMIESAIVGYSLLSRTSDRSAYLHKIIVDKDYKGLGIGSKLLDDALHRLSDKGIDELVFKCRTDNNSALRLYNRLGCKKISEEISDDGIRRYVLRKRMPIVIDTSLNIMKALKVPAAIAAIMLAAGAIKPAIENVSDWNHTDPSYSNVSYVPTINASYDTRSIIGLETASPLNTIAEKTSPIIHEDNSYESIQENDFNYKPIDYNNPQSEDAPLTYRYTVESGDILWKIVEDRFHPRTNYDSVRKIEDIVQMNLGTYPILNKDINNDSIPGDVIFEGMELTLPQQGGNELR